MNYGNTSHVLLIAELAHIRLIDKNKQRFTVIPHFNQTENQLRKKFYHLVNCFLIKRWLANSNGIACIKMHCISIYNV